MVQHGSHTVSAQAAPELVRLLLASHEAAEVGSTINIRVIKAGAFPQVRVTQLSDPLSGPRSQPLDEERGWEMRGGK